MGGELGSLVAAQLEAEPWVGALVGIDVDPPRRRLRKAEFHLLQPSQRERIVDVVRSSLGIDAEVAPTNIERYGNTTAATVAILFHELRLSGRVPSGALVCFVAFGAGSHWGALLYRQP